MGNRRRNTVLIDRDTGEELSGREVLVQEKQKLRSDFYMATKDGLLRLAKEEELTGEDMRVLLVYKAHLDYENYIQISQQEIADYLGLKQENVSRATKKLVAKNILVKGSKVGRHNTYRLNAFYGWKGRINKKYEDTFEEHSKLIK